MKTITPWKWGKSPKAARNWEPALKRFWEDPFDFSFAEFPMLKHQENFSVDIKESEKEYVVKAELPGMDEKDIDVSWQEGLLTIKGEKKDEKSEKDKQGYYSECSYGYFHRNIPFGDLVDWNNAKAKYQKGVLTVTLPKNENAQNRIEVKVE